MYNFFAIYTKCPNLSVKCMFIVLNAQISNKVEAMYL